MKRTPQRIGTIDRKTGETKIQLSLHLDGKGTTDIHTGIGFFDHMLTLLGYHGQFDLTVDAQGDLDVDYHHTVEDVGIVLGHAFREALGDCKGIHRYASGLIPMDEALAQIAIDISNRPYLAFSASVGKTKVGTFDVELLEEFLRAFVNNARLTLHVSLLSGDNLHHIIESVFKGLGIMLRQAVQVDPTKDTPSTKGVL